MRMCALDEIGRNSVSPCTRPRMMALMKSMRAFAAGVGRVVSSCSSRSREHGPAEH